MSSTIKTINNTNNNSGLDTTAVLSIQNATTSTSTSLGALVVNGGVGVSGDINIGGVFNSLQSYDTLTPKAYSTTLALTMNTGGMVYYITGGTPALVTNLTISSIPVTATGVLASYVFNLLYFTSSPYYYTAGTNTLSLTLTNAYNTIITPITSSGVSLPTTYSYIFQTITLVNKTGGTTPTFVAFNNIQGF